MDLSKAFDCIPHFLFIAKLDADGFNKKALTFRYSYLKRRKQSVNINDTESFFQILLSGVHQGSILGPIFFLLMTYSFLSKMLNLQILQITTQYMLVVKVCQNF